MHGTPRTKSLSSFFQSNDCRLTGLDSEREREWESRERISMYKYKHYYILEKCLSYSPGSSKRLEGSDWPGLGCGVGKGKSLMLLTSNNKSCSYLPPCLIKYFAKKTRLIDSPRLSILYWSLSVAVAPAELRAKWL